VSLNKTYENEHLNHCHSITKKKTWKMGKSHVESIFESLKSIFNVLSIISYYMTLFYLFIFSLLSALVVIGFFLLDCLQLHFINTNPLCRLSSTLSRSLFPVTQPQRTLALSASVLCKPTRWFSLLHLVFLSLFHQRSSSWPLQRTLQLLHPDIRMQVVNISCSFTLKS